MPAFHDADTDTDILSTMSARMSVSWNAGFTALSEQTDRQLACQTSRRESTRTTGVVTD